MTTGSGERTSIMGRIAGQGGLLLSGFAAAQAMSFARNAMIGHWLSKGDFGIAASITLMLQLIEILSDVGVDRLIVQADDGEDRRLMATAHAVLVARGLVTATILYLLAAPAASFFHVEAAYPAFAAAALVPLIKGFVHLDFRRRQRALDNRPYIAIECLPQAFALLALVPALAIEPSFHAVVWIALAQALAMVAASHMLAERPFEIGLDRACLGRLVRFGWPIWLSAFPLVAVYQGDRAIVGHALGIDALAGYAAAFMVTMVPGLVAAKAGHALMLPILARSRDRPEVFAQRCAMMGEVTVVAAAAYAAGFMLAGGLVLPLVFGPNFTGLGALAGWLGVMWAIRMVQAVPGMALMALGQTRPFLVAGIVRALGLIGAAAAAFGGAGVEGVAAAGVAAEAGSLLYVTWRLGLEVRGLGRACLWRFMSLVPAMGLALAVLVLLSPATDAAGVLLAAAGLVAALLIGGILVMPGLRGLAALALRLPRPPVPSRAVPSRA